MSLSPSFASLLRLVLCLAAGFAIGAWLRPATAAPERSPASPRRAAVPDIPDAGKETGPSLSEQLDRLYTTRTASFAARIRLEQFSLTIPPEEARRRVLTQRYTGNGFLDTLLWSRAALEEPESLLKAALQLDGERAPLKSLFHPWVRREPDAALAAASTNKEAANECVAAWADWAPAAAAAAVGPSSVIAQAWMLHDPPAALRWVDSFSNDSGMSPQKFAKLRDDIKGDLLREWVKADPVAGFAATAATPWGHPHTQPPGQPWSRPNDWIGNAFASFAYLSPELAARAAAALPNDRLSEGHGRIVASRLEEAEPGAGMRFARSLPPGPPREAAIGSSATSMAYRGEFTEAAALAAQIEDPVKKGVAAAGIIGYWTPRDPFAAHRWLVQLKSDLPPLSYAQVEDRFTKEAARCVPSLVPR